METACIIISIVMFAVCALCPLLDPHCAKLSSHTSHNGIGNLFEQAGAEPSSAQIA
jgi:hypothetical protein